MFLIQTSHFLDFSSVLHATPFLVFFFWMQEVSWEEVFKGAGRKPQKRMRRAGKKKKTFCTLTKCSAILSLSLSTDKQTDKDGVKVVKAFKEYGKTSVTVNYCIKHNVVRCSEWLDEGDKSGVGEIMRKKDSKRGREIEVQEDKSVVGMWCASLLASCFHWCVSVILGLFGLSTFSCTLITLLTALTKLTRSFSWKSMHLMYKPKMKG